MCFDQLVRTLKSRACFYLVCCSAILGFLVVVLHPVRTPDTSHSLYVKKSSNSNGTHSVKIFQPELRKCDFKATLKVPGSGNIMICTYDPKVENFLSIYEQKINDWNYDLIKKIMFIFQKDKLKRRNRRPGNRKSDLTDLRKTLSKNGSSLAGDQTLSMLDLGCRIGIYTLSVAKMGHRVLAVDAMQENLQLLATSLRMNHLADRVMLLLEVRELVQVQVKYDNKGASIIKSDDRHNEITDDVQRSPVSAICLNDLIPYVRTDRVLIKMDMEGFQAKTLLCAALFFAIIDVPYIVMEWVFHSNTFNGAYIIDFFSSRGYSPYSNRYGNASLTPGTYLSWPADVFWVKER